MQPWSSESWQSSSRCFGHYLEILSSGTSYYYNGMQLTGLRAAADAGRGADKVLANINAVK